MTDKQEFSLEWLVSPWMLTLSVIIGCLLGHYVIFNPKDYHAISSVYLGLLEMCVIPLVILAISTSLARLLRANEAKHYLKRMGVTFAICLLSASLTGILMAKATHVGWDSSQSTQQLIGKLLLKQDKTEIKTSHTFHSAIDYIHSIIPNNIVRSISEDQFVAIVIFSILFGTALGLIRTKASHYCNHTMVGLYDTFITLINGLIYGLPIGIMFLVADEVSNTGVGVFLALGKLILIVYLTGIILSIVATLIIRLYSRASLLDSLRFLRKTLMVAFITQSAFASLPLALNDLEKNFKIKRAKVNLLAPLGICFNPGGKCAFFSILLIYIAHLYHIHFSWSAMCLVVVCSMCMAIAAGGIPIIATFSILSIFLKILGLPVSTAVIIFLTVSQVVDPIITLVDMHINCMSIVVITHSDKKAEAQFEEDIEKIEDTL